jgi:hypothetical protein
LAWTSERTFAIATHNPGGFKRGKGEMQKEGDDGVREVYEGPMSWREKKREKRRGGITKGRRAGRREKREGGGGGGRRGGQQTD